MRRKNLAIIAFVCAFGLAFTAGCNRITPYDGYRGTVYGEDGYNGVNARNYDNVTGYNGINNGYSGVRNSYNEGITRDGIVPTAVSSYRMISVKRGLTPTRAISCKNVLSNTLGSLAISGSAVSTDKTTVANSCNLNPADIKQCAVYGSLSNFLTGTKGVSARSNTNSSSTYGTAPRTTTTTPNAATPVRAPGKTYTAPRGTSSGTMYGTTPRTVTTAPGTTTTTVRAPRTTVPRVSARNVTIPRTRAYRSVAPTMSVNAPTGIYSGYNANPYASSNYGYPNSYNYSGTNNTRGTDYQNNYNSANNYSYPNSYNYSGNNTRSTSSRNNYSNNYSAGTTYSDNRGYAGVRAPAADNMNNYTAVASNRRANLNCMAVIEMSSQAKVEAAVSAIRSRLGSTAGVIKTNGRFIMFALTSDPTRVEMAYDKYCRA